MEYQKDARYERIGIKSINCQSSLFIFALFLTTLSLAQNTILTSGLPPPTLIVFSITSGNPLHMVLGDDPNVTTNVTVVQGYFDPDALLITANYNGQGVLYLTESNNTYYVAIDYNNTIVPLLEDEIDNADMYTFREEATDDAQQVRYYLQMDEDKYYLMVASNGNIVALNASDLVLGSQNDTQSRFTAVYV